MPFVVAPTMVREDRFTILITAGTLGARAGAPNIANTDTGEFTTAAAAANQVALPLDFGPGRGRWRARDLQFLEIEGPEDTGNAATAGGLHLVADADVAGGVNPRIVNNDLVLTVHNRGAGVAGPIRMRLRYRRLGRPAAGLAERS